MKDLVQVPHSFISLCSCEQFPALFYLSFSHRRNKNIAIPINSHSPTKNTCVLGAKILQQQVEQQTCHIQLLRNIHSEALTIQQYILLLTNTVITKVLNTCIKLPGYKQNQKNEGYLVCLFTGDFSYLSYSPLSSKNSVYF